MGRGAAKGLQRIGEAAVGRQQARLPLAELVRKEHVAITEPWCQTPACAGAGPEGLTPLSAVCLKRPRMVASAALEQR